MANSLIMALPRGRVGDLSGNQKKTTKEKDLQKAVITIRHECVCVCVHVHVHAQLLSHPEGMAMLQVWSLVGRWHSQCGVSGVSGPKIDDPPLMCGAHKGTRPPARPWARQSVLTLPN